MTTIMGLMNQIEEGEVVLPAIQRDFVWTEQQTAKLLDSVMRGYPIGIALLWETYNDIQYRPFVSDFRSGTIHTYKENRRKNRIRVVLDGQQRLQSLFIALRGKRDGNELYLDVLSGEEDEDLSDERFLFEFMPGKDAQQRNTETEEEISQEEAAEDEPTADVDEDDEGSEPPPFWWVAVSDLFGMGAREKQDHVRSLSKRLGLSEEHELLLERNLTIFDEVLTRDQNILKLSTIDENLASESPYRQTEADVLEIFVRINREGTPLSRSDLIFSMLKLGWKESAEGMPEFVEAINQGNAFDLDTDFVVRCLFAVSELGGRLNIDLLRNKENVARLQANFSQCCDAIRATVDFVQTECRCESSRLLGSSSTLVPLVYYVFHLPRHDVPNAQVERLRTGTYLLGLATPFSRYAESRVGAVVRQTFRPLAEANDHEFPLEDVIDWVADWEGIESVEDLAQSNARLSLHLLQGRGGAKVQYSRNSPEVDHIFPRAELRRKKYDEEDINDLANFWILAQGKNRNKSDKHPKEYFKDVSKRQLDNALIDRKMLDYRRYTTFIAKRRQKMTKRLGRILDLSDEAFQDEEDD